MARNEMNVLVLFLTFLVSASGFLFDENPLDLAGLSKAIDSIFVSVNLKDSSSSENCMSLLPVAYINTRRTTNRNGDVNKNTQTLVLESPNVVTRIELDLDACHEIYTSHTNMVKMMPIELNYTEASNPLQANTSFYKVGKLYDWKTGNTSNKLYIDVDPAYVNTVTATTPPSLSCVLVQLYGCSLKTSGVCGQTDCIHGTCVGSGVCSCNKGYIGEKCEIPITDLSVDNFNATSGDHGKIQTADGEFLITGSVEFESDPSSRDIQRKVYQNKRHSHHHGSTHFHGGHIQLGHTHCGGHGQYRCSNSHCSNFNQYNGYCHSSSVQFSGHHDHHHQVHLYNTHSNGHIANPGSSLCYYNHHLHMNVNNGNHRCQLSVFWHPTPNHAHTIASSYSPHYGCSIYVNGHHHGSSSCHHDHHHQSSHNTNLTPLCVGSCNSQHNLNKTVDYLIHSLTSIGTSAVNLALNGLLGLLGNAIIPHVTQTSKPQVTTPPPTTTTAKTTTPTPPPTTTTAKTTTPTPPPTTTTAKTSTATLATTIAPFLFTATKPHTSISANTKSNGSLTCYSCQDTPTDGACKNVVTCKTGETCSVFHDNNGYTHTCLEKNLCKAAKTMANGGCWICCDSSLCNKQCSPTAQCQDTANCALLHSTGYDVCHDQSFASSECKKTCGLCSSG